MLCYPSFILTHSRRFVILGILIVLVGVVVFSKPKFITGSLLDSQQIATNLKVMADTNQDGTLTAREIRTVLLQIIRKVILGDAAFDINGDETVNRDDIRATTQGFRSLLSAVCGNGQPEADEECDDGNTVNTDACTNTCRYAACGDGFVQVPEQCDTGGADEEDGCALDCTLNDECTDGVDNDQDGLVDRPHFESLITFDTTEPPYPPYNLYTGHVDEQAHTAYLVSRSNTRTTFWEVMLSPFARGRTLHILLGSTSATSLDRFSDGAFVVNDATKEAYVSVQDPDTKILARIHLTDMSQDDATDRLALDGGDINLTTGVIDPQGTYAYFGNFVTGLKNRIVKVNLSTFQRVGHIESFGGEDIYTGFHTSLMAPDGQKAYFSGSGFVARVDLASFSADSPGDVLHLARQDGTQNLLQVSAMSPDGNYAYFVSVPTTVFATDPRLPSQIYKVNLQTFTLDSTVVLPVSDGRVQSMDIDPTTGHLFLGTQTFFSLPTRGLVVELTPTLQRVTAYPTELAGQNNLHPLFVGYDQGIQYIYTGLTAENPVKFAQYRIGGVEPACSL